MTWTVVGVGASGGAERGEVGALIDAVLAEAGIAPGTVWCVATADGRAGEHAVRAASRARGFPLVTFPVDVLAQVEVPHPSEIARARAGTASVAEAAALHAACAVLHTVLPTALRAGGRAVPSPGAGEARLVVEKRRSARATAAVARIVPP